MIDSFLIRKYGGPAVLERGRLDRQPLDPDDVRIDVHAASVNPLDLRIRDGALKVLLPYRFPLVLGNDCSGVVTEVGLNPLLDSTVIRPLVDAVFPFEQTALAIARVEEGKSRGKVVVQMRAD